METQTTYLTKCLMDPDQAAIVLQMIGFHKEFSAIRITINPDGETNMDEKLLVVLAIPKEGVCMLNFFRKFHETLQEQRIVIQRERE